MIDATDTATNGETRQAPRLRTPDQILGPYFPTGQVLLARADLTRRPDRVGNAEGEIVEIRGRVLNMRGEPVPRATLTIWQANAFGRYAHANDTNPAPPDPNFVGCVRIRSGDDGRYAIKTIKPRELSGECRLDTSAAYTFRDRRPVRTARDADVFSWGGAERP
jgi:protocatechuate 3,4-dioxygenase beta subunit